MTEELSRGAKLRRARLERGWSIEKVAQDLKLAPKQVQALEEDRREALPAEIFVKGFVKNYARLLGSPVSDFEESAQGSDDHLMFLSPRNETGTISSIEPPSLPLHSSAAAANRRYLIAALVIVVLGGLIALIRPHHIDWVRAQVAALRPQSPTPVVTATGTISPAPPLVNPAPPVTAMTSEAVPGRSTQAHDSALTLKASGDSWVEVKSEGGELLFSGMLHAGDVRDIEVIEEARLVIGNAPALSVQWQGQELDLGPHTRDVVARLTVTTKER